MIEESSGVFLGGGNQVKLVSTLSGTPVADAIWAHYARGGVVGGTSAGAAALTELTLAGNEVDEDGKLVEQYIGPGLGLLGFRTLIDTHFTQRRRLYRLFVAIAGNREIIGPGTRRRHCDGGERRDCDRRRKGRRDVRGRTRGAIR